MGFYDELAAEYAQFFPLSGDAKSLYRSLLDLARPRVCDAGCADGQFALWLAAQGFSVLGIDLGEQMIARANTALQSAAPEERDRCRFAVLDMVDLSALGQTFDAIFCTGNTLSHLTDDGLLERVMGGFAESLAPEGTLAVQIVNYLPLRTTERIEFPVLTGKRRTFHRTYLRSGPSEIRFLGRLVPHDGTAATTIEQPLRIWWEEDLRAVAARAGLTHRVSYGDLSGAAYTAESPALIAVFLKG